MKVCLLSCLRKVQNGSSGKSPDILRQDKALTVHSCPKEGMHFILLNRETVEAGVNWESRRRKQRYQVYSAHEMKMKGEIVHKASRTSHFRIED